MMKSGFNTVVCLLAISSCLGAASRLGAQASAPLYDPPPAYPGFQLPHVAGTLRYSLSGSGSFTAGDNQVSRSGFAVSGNLGYISRSPTSPFSLIYSGGESLGSNYGNSALFQSLSASQVLTFKKWQVLFADSVSYLPSSPVGGLSGVAGIGDIGSAPVQVGNLAGDDLQSNNGARINNNASASVGRKLTGRTSLTAAGSYEILRFPGAGSGLESNDESGNLGLSHIISPRTQIGASYYFSRLTYSGFPLTYDSQGANISLSHSWSPRLTGSISGGPIHTSSTGAQATNSFSFSGGLAYLHGLNDFTLSASRQVRPGSGITTATTADVVGGGVSRSLGRFTRISGYASYDHSTTLASLITPVPFTISSETAGVQLSRSVSRTISVFGSYNIRRQETPANAFTVNALQGTPQTVGFGLTYSPRPITIGRR